MASIVLRGGLAAVLAATLAACSQSREAGGASGGVMAKSGDQRRPAPDFALKDADGKTVRLSDYKGRVVLLNFWATWCGPCKIEIPWFNEFEQKMKGRGFAVLGISMDEDGWGAVKPFVQEIKMGYRTLMGNDSVAQLYGGVDSLPTSFLIDREGRIAFVHVGLVSKSDYEHEIEQLLGAAPKSAGGTAGSGLAAGRTGAAGAGAQRKGAA